MSCTYYLVFVQCSSVCMGSIGFTLGVYRVLPGMPWVPSRLIWISCMEWVLGLGLLCVLRLGWVK